MTISDQARNAAISLEAKKDRLVQLQSTDWKVTFTVQTIDMDARLTKAPMGTRYAMVLVEIGDDELPVAPAKEVLAQPQQVVDRAPAGAKRDKMDWREMQPAAQAALRCEDPTFRAFLREERGISRVDSPTTAAIAVREICGVESRAELSTNHRKRVIWHQLDSQYLAWKAVEHA